MLNNENNFKQNQIAVIYARNKLVEAQIERVKQKALAGGEDSSDGEGDDSK